MATQKRNLGCNLGAYGRDGWENSLRAIAEAGFTCTFTGYGPVGDTPAYKQVEVYTRSAQALGLVHESVHAAFNGINQIWLPGDEGEFQTTRLIETVDACADGGVSIVVCHLSSGNKAPGVTDLGASRFDRVVERAGEKGIKIAFENQRKLANMAFVMERYQDLPQVGFCWDMGHEFCFAGGMDFLTLFGKRTLCTHLHDNDALPDGDLHRIPFDASLDIPQRMRTLKATGYTGTLMLEVHGGVNPMYADLDAAAFYRRAYAACERMRVLLDGE